jgi:hypothetical protein
VRHTPSGVAHFHLYHDHHCVPRIPAIKDEENQQFNSSNWTLQEEKFVPAINLSIKHVDDTSCHSLTWIIPGWSRVLFPGQGVPSCMVHPSSGIFCAFATNAFTRTLNSSYSLCKTRRQTQFSIRRPLLSYTENHIVALCETKVFLVLQVGIWMNANVSMVCVTPSLPCALSQRLAGPYPSSSQS